MTKAEYDRYRLFHNPNSNILFVYDYDVRKFIHEIKLEWLTDWTGVGCSLPYMDHVVEFLVNRGHWG